MRGPSALRGAMDPGAMVSTLRATVNGQKQGRAMELSKTEARVIFWRNMVVLLLSLVVITKTLCAILRWTNRCGPRIPIEIEPDL